MVEGNYPGQSAVAPWKKALKVEPKKAQLEVGFVCFQNLGYRAALETENPARTVQIDELIKGKDAQLKALHARIEGEIASLHASLATEKRKRNFDRTEAACIIEGLEGNSEWQEAALVTFSRGREELQQWTDALLAMFKRKLYRDKKLKTIVDSHD